MKALGFRLRALVYRAHNPRWSFDPLSGEGAKRYGGRFNPQGVPALYTSLRFETAWLEAQQGFAFKSQPLTLCAYEVDCREILDLTDPGVCRKLGISPSDLACPWERMVEQGGTPPTWALAEKCIAEDIAGIKVPSFAQRATEVDLNVVFWKWSSDHPTRVVLIDDENRLARDDSLRRK